MNFSVNLLIITFEFSYDNDLVIVKNGEKEIRVSVLEFQKQAHFLLTKLKEKTNATFSIPEIENFINSFDSHSLKAKSSVKSDIRIVIHDQRAGTNPELGFSIKSQLGGASTLLNAGKTTNFIFKINNLGLSQNQILEINEIETRSKIKDRIEKITELGGILEFQKTESSVFGNNLVLIDSALPKIIAESLEAYLKRHQSMNENCSQNGTRVFFTTGATSSSSTSTTFFDDFFKGFISSLESADVEVDLDFLDEELVSESASTVSTSF